MRERRLSELDLQPFDWYAHLSGPALPLDGEEGERMFQREAARVRRYGGLLTVMSIVVEPARAATIALVGELLSATVRDCDFVAEGNPGELLIGLPGADSAAGRICLERMVGRVGKRPVTLTAGIAELGDNETVDDTVARARRDRRESL